MVGRDVLIGLLVGAVVEGTMLAAILFEPALAANPPSSSASPFTSLRHAGFYLLYLPYPATLSGLVFLLLLVLLRTVLRHNRLAAVALTVLVSLPMLSIVGATPRSPASLVAVLAATLRTFTLLRFGLLAEAVTLLTVFYLGTLPISLDQAAWYFPTAVLPLLTLAALAVAAFVVAVGGRIGPAEGWLDRD
jgi:hypothetical protein